jgi:hypothetical protein
MRLTKKATQDHQPCEICRERIRKGESFWTFLRDATAADDKAGFYKFYNHFGRRQAVAKSHASCWQMRKDWRQVVRGLMRLWWGSTYGRPGPRSAG